MSDINQGRTAWRKSSYSNGNGGTCVELAHLGDGAVRDSKNPDGPVLDVALRPFLAAVKFDRI